MSGSHNHNYVGETDTKRIARLMMYEEMARRMGHRDPTAGAVCLAGFEGAEYGCLRWIMRFQDEHMVFVDNARDNRVENVKKKSSLVTTFKDDIHDVLKSLQDREMGVVSLDFMGYVDWFPKMCLREAARVVAPSGFVTYTFIRGREQQGTPHWKDVLATRVSHPQDGMTELDQKRYACYTNIALEELRHSKGDFEFERVYAIAWDSGNSPMGALVFQKRPIPKVAPLKKNVIEMVRDNADVKRRLRIISMRLIREGFTTPQVAEILNMPKGSVAAWLAHETRGSYR